MHRYRLERKCNEMFLNDNDTATYYIDLINVENYNPCIEIINQFSAYHLDISYILTVILTCVVVDIADMRNRGESQLNEHESNDGKTEGTSNYSCDQNRSQNLCTFGQQVIATCTFNNLVK